MIGKSIREDLHQAMTSHETKRMFGLIDLALLHITEARLARKVNDSFIERENRSQAVELISELSRLEEETCEEPLRNLLNLYSYMIDRLSISHSASEFPPLNEVEWLLKSLKDVFSHRTSR